MLVTFLIYFEQQAGGAAADGAGASDRGGDAMDLIGVVVLLGVAAAVWWSVRKLRTRRPAVGVPKRGIDAVRAALLALNRPDGVFRVRDGAPEGVNLVAEVRTDGRVFRTTSLIQMVLDAERRVVRSCRAIDIRGVEFDGVVYDPEQGWFPSLGEPAGERHRARAVQRELRDTVLRAGWTWRGVLFLRRRGVRVPWVGRDKPHLLRPRRRDHHRA
jgi:hypothetical protein